MYDYMYNVTLYVALGDISNLYIYIIISHISCVVKKRTSKKYPGLFFWDYLLGPDERLSGALGAIGGWEFLHVNGRSFS